MEVDDIVNPGDLPVLDIQPYQFEPIRARNNNAEIENLPRNDSDSADQDNFAERLLNTDWFVLYFLCF